MDCKGNVLKSTSAIEVVNTKADVGLDPTNTIGPEPIDAKLNLTGCCTTSNFITSDSRTIDLQRRTAQLVMPTDPTDNLTVSLAQDIHLGLQQTRVAKLKLNKGVAANLSAQIGVVIPTESFMTSNNCNFMEGY